MDKFIKDQLWDGLKYVPINLLKSYFIRRIPIEIQQFYKKGYLCGVCHPNNDYEQIKAANIGWVRIDIPFPYDTVGNLSTQYLAFKERSKRFQKNCIKVMAITPYPQEYIAYDADIRTISGERRVREIARFMIQDLQGIVDGIQVTNEMGMPHFTLPLTIDEASRFIGVQLEEMYELRGSIVIGYNSAMIQADLHRRMKPWYRYCDYVGMDIYIGCFGKMRGYLWEFEFILRYLWAMTGKPVILQEFGYISGGETKSPAEKRAVLMKYDVSDEADAGKQMERFMEKLPVRLKEYVKSSCSDASMYHDFLFKGMCANHLYCELPEKTKIPGYPHTPEGQAAFFRNLMKRIGRLEFVRGVFAYCYCDAEVCGYCGQTDCPVETRWGLVSVDGSPKPAYYAIQEAFGKLNVEREIGR